jgi:hypothetical protein
MKTSDISLGGRLKIGLNGINGCGKTRAWASFPGPIYCFDFDNRMKTVRKDFPERTDIEFDTYGLSNFKNFDKKLEQLQSRCPYATVILDSITSSTTTSVLYSLGETGGKTIAGLSVPSFDEYNVETTMVTKVLEIFKELPCHIIITMHPISRLDTSGAGKAMKIVKTQQIVSYGMKLQSIIPNYMDELYSFQTAILQSGETKRLCYTEVDDDNSVQAKTSLPLPGHFDVTDKKFYEVLKGLLKEKGVELDEKVSKEVEFR